ncbi:MAG: hypothetical protein AB1571_01610 [Nanoarchaeota archaeon]
MKPKNDLSKINELSDVIKKEDFIFPDTNIFIPGLVDDNGRFRDFNYICREIKQNNELYPTILKFFKTYCNNLSIIYSLCNIVLPIEIRNELEKFYDSYVKRERGIGSILDNLNDRKNRIRSGMYEIKKRIKFYSDMKKLIKIAKGILPVSKIDVITEEPNGTYQNIYDFVRFTARRVYFDAKDEDIISDADRALVAHAIYYSTKNNARSFIMSRDSHIRNICHTLKKDKQDFSFLKSASVMLLYFESNNLLKEEF